MTTRMSDNLDEVSELVSAGDRMINISITPWGVIPKEDRDKLIGINKDVEMNKSSNILNNLYDCFLLVDDGTG